MRLREVLTITQAQVYELPYPSALDREVQVAFGSDLMSDVLRYDVAQGLLITGLVNPQVVRTAEMADAAAILLVRDKRPQPETHKLAEQVGIPILGTQWTMFETCGRLYRAGLQAATRCDELT
jgi:predicted transcriptional regulator